MTSHSFASKITSQSESHPIIPSIFDTSHLVTNYKLYGYNFLQLSQSIFMYIYDRGKDGHLISETTTLEETDPKYRSWKVDDYLVMS